MNTPAPAASPAHIPLFEMPNAARMALRDKITALGNAAPAPENRGRITIALARDKFVETHGLMTAHGFVLEERYYFPLGSDKPAMELRHDVTYAGTMYPHSHWLYARYL